MCVCVACQAHVSVEELSAARDVVTAQISAVGIKNVELMSKSDPMLEICKRPPVNGFRALEPLSCYVLFLQA